MKQNTREAWITLNASYEIRPLSDAGQLMDDASMWLEGAHGVTRSLSELLNRDVDANPDDLAHALWAASMLIQMGQRSAQEAHERLQKKQSAK
jgi:thioredoxin-like negative regulator of GroEL